MPTSVPVWYERKDPHSLTLPGEFSTWFLPGTICVFGLLTTFVGAVLLYYARKPIELPDLRRAHLEKPTERIAKPSGH